MERFNDNDRAEIHDIVVRVSVLEERSINMDRRLKSTDEEIILLRKEVGEIKSGVYDMKDLLLTHMTTDEKNKNRILIAVIFILLGIFVPELWPLIKAFIPA